MIALTLAQDVAQTVVEAKPWWHQLLSPLFLTILFIFLTTVITVLVKNRKKDKCLKLFHDYHVSYITTAGKTIWGDVLVYSKGLIMQFDAPYRNSRGMIKSSALIYEADMANCLALCRVDGALTEAESKARKKQLGKSIHPGMMRRSWRSIRNLFNTLNDAFSKAFTTVLGQVAKTKPGGAAVIASQQGSIDSIGQTLLSTVGNAYEPILERNIGKAVVLELSSPADPDKKAIELHGYLAEYSDKYLAVMNHQHTPFETIELEVSEPVERPGVKVDLTAENVTITCTAPEVVVVRQVVAAAHSYDLAVPITNGNSLRLHRPKDAAVKVTLDRTRHIDIVCPRAVAAVHFGSAPLEPDPQKQAWQGLAPTEDAEGEDGITGSETPTASGDAAT